MGRDRHTINQTEGPIPWHVTKTNTKPPKLPRLRPPSSKLRHTPPKPQSPRPKKISIQGITFTYTTPYVEGSVLTAGEANQLNTVRGENMRNNFATKIKTALAELRKSTGDETSELSEEAIAAFRAEFAKYDAEYVFSGKRTSRGPVDPVMAKAKKMVRETIESALRAKGYKPADLVEGKMDELIAKYLDSHPEVVDEARAQIAKVKEAAADALGGVDLDSLKAPSAAPEPVEATA